MGKKVLITGATSYIAAALIKRILSNNIYSDIYAVIRPDSPNRRKVPEDDRIHLIELEMSEYKKLLFLKTAEIDIWYHFAWEGVRGAAREDDMLQKQNQLAAMECINCAAAMEVPCFIGIGSQAEYGEARERMHEKLPPAPTTAYGKAKVQACDYGVKACRGTKTRFIWARIFSIYGRGENKNTLLMSAIENMSKDLPIALSPCEHLWNYIYLEDAAQALYLLGDCLATAGIYNIASDDTRILKEFVLELKELLSSESVLEFGAISYGDKIPYGIHPDIEKIKKELNWKPKYSFKRGVDEIRKDWGRPAMKSQV